MASLPMPGLRFGDYPERAEAVGVTRWRRGSLLGSGGAGRLERRARQVAQQAAALRPLSAAALTQQRAMLQQRLLRDGLVPASIDAACALAAEAARRALGLSPYLPQLVAALAMLEHKIAEMATGEGKSLATALAAGVGALAGMPVHVLTANDYLVERDAQSFAPFYAALGLSVAWVVTGLPPAVRRLAYAQAVVYVTAREVAFDYLRDRLAHGAARDSLKRRVQALADPQAALPLLRGLCLAVLDEADNILVDEAQMPLILSREVGGGADRAFLWQAHALSAKLAADIDYRLEGTPRTARLTEAGRARAAALAAPLGPLWMNARHRDETLVTALTARHLLQRDRDYVLVPKRDALTGRSTPEVAIVDRFSGRVADGRKWSRGLHALVSIKEGCAVPADTETLAQITFQRFFRRYHRLGGMSGTLREAGSELRTLYGCSLVQVPLRLPSRRQRLPTRCYLDDASRRQAVVPRVAALVAAGRPVLIGCDSVDASQAMAAALAAAAIPHAVLDARFDGEEAAIIAEAGRAAQVTVATNMAGRGTDIRLDAAALAAGGLHVLSCQHNSSRRHDRQLAGRAGRQGEPGSSETWTTLTALRRDGGLPARLAPLLARPAADGRLALAPSLLDRWIAATQRRDEARQARLRRQLFRQDLALDDGLSFSGSNE